MAVVFYCGGSGLGFVDSLARVVRHDSHICNAVTPLADSKDSVAEFRVIDIG